MLERRRANLSDTGTADVSRFEQGGRRGLDGTRASVETRNWSK